MEPNLGQRILRCQLYAEAEGNCWGVLYSPKVGGSQDWYIIGQEDWLALETGRLAVSTEQQAKTLTALS